MLKVNLYHFKKGRSAWFEIACTGSNEALKLEAHPDLHHVALMDLQGSQNLRHNQNYSKNPGYAITEYNRLLSKKRKTQADIKRIHEIAELNSFYPPAIPGVRKSSVTTIKPIKKMLETHSVKELKERGIVTERRNRQLVAKDGTIYSRPKSPNKNYKVNPETPPKKKAVKRKATPAQLKARVEFARRVRAGEFRK